MQKKRRLLSGPTCLLILSVITGCRCLRNSGAVSMNERNAWEDIPQDKIVLIVNGDDVGIDPVFTDATLDACLKRKISSASILTPGPDADRAIALWKEHPELDIGIHFCLTGRWEPLTSGASLRNENGLMWDTSEEAARHVKPEEAAVEWEAQIKKVVDAGVSFSHIDSHMGCYFLSRALLMAAYNLAVKYRVLLISGFIPGQMPSSLRGFFPFSSYTGIYTLGNDEETLENRTAAYWQLLGKLQPGIHYLFSHQGLEPPDKSISGDLGLRINDYKFWTSEATHAELAARGIVMISCALLKKGLRQALQYADFTVP